MSFSSLVPQTFFFFYIEKEKSFCVQGSWYCTSFMTEIWRILCPKSPPRWGQCYCAFLHSDERALMALVPQSLSGALRDASPFRHGAGHTAHESKTPHRTSKWGTQTTAAHREARTKLILKFYPGLHKAALGCCWLWLPAERLSSVLVSSTAEDLDLSPTPWLSYVLRAVELCLASKTQFCATNPSGLILYC